MSAIDQKRFKALGQNWIARFDFNAICNLEERVGSGFWEFVSPMMIQLDEGDAGNEQKVMEAVTGLRMSDLRLVMFFALQSNHAEMTEALAGDIIQDLGGFSGAMEIVAWAIMQAIPFDTSEDEGGATGAPNPPKKARTAKRGARRG